MDRESSVPSVHDPISQMLLALAFSLSHVLFVLCTLPPNAASERRARGRADDRIMGFLHVQFLPHVKSMMLATHALIIVYTDYMILTYPGPSRLLCPSAGFPASASSRLLAWNWALACVLLAAVGGGILRLLAYRNLGTDFTFTLNRPSGLVTKGVHGYMQHPSYTGLVLVTVTMMWLEARFDGPFACLVPRAWLPALVGMQSYLVAVASLVICGIAWVRVADEEKMLKESFGREWVEYHSKTARFIPGLF